MATHVRALRAHECFRTATIVLVPEANLGNEAQEIGESLIGAFEKLRVVCDRDDQYGIHTNPGSPQLFVRAVSSLFSHNAISYHRDIVSANPYTDSAVTNAQRVKKARNELEKQLRAFRRVSLLPKSLVSRSRYSYTGKADKDNQRSSSMRDDLVMALLFGIFFAQQRVNGLTFERGFDRRLLDAEAADRQRRLAPLVDTIVSAPFMRARVGSRRSHASNRTQSDFARFGERVRPTRRRVK